MQEKQAERAKDRQNMIVEYSWMMLDYLYMIYLCSFMFGLSLLCSKLHAVQNKMILQAKPQLAVTTCVDNASADNMNQVESISSNS